MPDRVYGVTEQLKSLGTAAFPALIAHRDDDRFSHYTPPTGSSQAPGDRNSEPWTVGRTCMAIVIQQISPGHEYKGSVTVIPGIVGKDALPEWWKTRSSLSLTALRKEVIEQVLAKERHKATAGNHHAADRVKALEADLASLRSDKKKEQPDVKSGTGDLTRPSTTGGKPSAVPTFPLRTDPPPKEWKAGDLNKGLPYRWESGTVHILAWQVTEDKGNGTDLRMTHVLVLKRFDQPTEKGGDRWVLARLDQDPKDKDWPWRGQMLIIPPVRRGEPMPKLTDAQSYGYEFYKDLPTNEQVDAFLRETRWTPSFGNHGPPTHSLTFTTTLIAGGVDRALWNKLFGRDVPTDLFPELKTSTDDKK
jgi:hypothetical protein